MSEGGLGFHAQHVGGGGDLGFHAHPGGGGMVTVGYKQTRVIEAMLF